MQHVTDNEIGRVIDELEREHGGDAWHGSPLRQILADVDHEQASAKPLPNVHSIWEIVLHMTAWKNEVRRRIGGAPAGLPVEGDWPAPATPDPQTWRQAVDALEDSQRALVEAIARLPESVLFTATKDTRDPAAGQGVSYYVLLHGIVQHDVYHSGQIALLKKAVQGA